MYSDRQQLILQEMGLGPLWLLRQTSPEALSANPELAPTSTLESSTPGALPVSDPQRQAGLSSDQALVADLQAQTVPPSATLVRSAQADELSMTMRMGWPELTEAVSNCQACGLCKGRQQTVFGVGDQQARWLFIGEGPGYNENLQGLPFVGEAGKLLDNMMLALGLQRGQNTYIANIVKCRPTDAQGKDRPPSAQEIAACLPYLQRQIALINPSVIVALGKTAAIALLGLDPQTPVSQLRGKVHQYQDIPLVATYHPAYLLRQPLEKAKAWQDLCQARALLATA